MPRTCNDCRFGVFEDYGYSNWTVEGTDFSCAKRLHPEGTFDRFYGEDERLKFAEKCPGFEAGTPVSLDVDGEDYAELSEDQKAVLKMHREAK